MFLKSWILLSALVAIAYAAIEPLDLTSIQELQKDTQPQQHLREKRFILAKKALLVGGAVGFGVGLAKGKLLGGSHHIHHYPVYHEQHYPVYHEPQYGHGGGYGGGWSSASASAHAGSGYW